MSLRSHSLLYNAAACVLALTLVIVLSVGFLAHYLQQQASSDVETTLTGLSTILTEQADRSLQAIDLVQQNVIDDASAAGAVDEASFTEFATTPAVHQMLRSRISGLPQASAVSIIDNNGKLLNFSRVWPIPEANVSDRDYFQGISSDPAVDRFVSKPSPNRSDGRSTLYIARRFSGPHGEFLGIVLGAVELDYFRRLYQQVLPAPDYSFSLFRGDGMLLTRAPGRPDLVGIRVGASNPEIAAKFTDNGSVYRVKSPIDQLERLVTSKPLVHFPIRFNLSRTVDAAYARWRTQLIFLIIAAALLFSGLISILWLLARTIAGQRRLANSERARHRAETKAESERAIRKHLAHIGIALDNMAQGLCMLDADGRLAIANEQLSNILGLPGLPPVGSSINALLRLVLPAKLLSRHETRSLFVYIRRTHARNQPIHVTVLLQSGRSILMHMQPMETGGLILTLSDVTEQRMAEAKIAFLAHNDTLTSLPNRTSLVASLERELQQRSPGEICAMLSINLQRFREVNDTFGHAVGDLLLQEIATRLHGFTGASGLIARLGGDEFVVVLTKVESQEQLAASALQLTEALATPCQLEGLVISVAIRMGVALVPDDAVTAEGLLQNAQLAMHFSRLEAATAPVFFRPDMVGAMQARRQLETELLAGLNEEQFELHYQPLVRLASRQVVGFEALIRWRHPERGLVPPLDFIPLVEQTGLIVPIGEWVLRTACLEAMTWPADRKIAVNLSPVQLRDRGLIPAIRDILDETGLCPSRLELEITETVLMRDTTETLEVLHELHRLGISIALDDFGTGFSSLSYLRSFPFDKVKIDRAFVRDLADSRDARAIVRAILGLCAELGINTLAEGIELDEQAEALKAEGCRDGQGFLLGRPTPAAELAPFLQSHISPARPVLASLV